MRESEDLSRALLGHLKNLRAAGVRYVALGGHPPPPERKEAPPSAPYGEAKTAEAPAPYGEERAAPAQAALLPGMNEETLLAPRAAPRRRPAGPPPPPLPFEPAAEMDLEELGAAVDGCLRCKLGAGRRNLVFGVGNPQAKLVFVGEAPGADEDAQGIPFVGRAGQMLTRMIENVIEVPRKEVYICNILKCRPPGNRNPEADEIECCEPYLQKQIEIIRPRLIVALGKFAAQWLLQTKTPISRLRGRFGRYRGIPCLPTYHPAYLLRNPREKKAVHQDLLKIKAAYHGEAEPEIEIFG